MEGFFFTGAEIPGDDHTGAYGNTVEKADQKEDQVPGGADCGQGIASEKVSDNKRIGHVVKLLKKVSEKERNGESDNAFPDGSLGHRSGGFGICCHQKKLPSAVNGYCYFHCKQSKKKRQCPTRADTEKYLSFREKQHALREKTGFFIKKIGIFLKIC